MQATSPKPHAVRTVLNGVTCCPHWIQSGFRDSSQGCASAGGQDDLGCELAVASFQAGQSVSGGLLVASNVQHKPLQLPVLLLHSVGVLKASVQ